MTMPGGVSSVVYQLSDVDDYGTSTSVLYKVLCKGKLYLKPDDECSRRWHGVLGVAYMLPRGYREYSASAAGRSPYVITCAAKFIVQ